MKIFILFLILCISTTLSAEDKNFFIKSVKVSEKKANGKSWDLQLGKDPGHPDVKVIIYVKNTDPKSKDEWKKYYTSATSKDTFTTAAVMDPLLKLAAGTQIKIDILDEDAMSDDKVGTQIINITGEDQEETEITFDQVAGFQYVLTTKTYEDYVKSLEANK